MQSQRTSSDFSSSFFLKTNSGASVPQHHSRQRDRLQFDMKHSLSNSFSGALRTFAYFMASGTHYNLEGIDYLSLYGNEPSAIEQAFAIYTNVIQLDENGQVLNAKHAEKRATDYLRAYYDPSFEVKPAYEDWEICLHAPPSLQDSI